MLGITDEWEAIVLDVSAAWAGERADAERIAMVARKGLVVPVTILGGR